MLATLIILSGCAEGVRTETPSSPISVSSDATTTTSAKGKPAPAPVPASLFAPPGKVPAFPGAEGFGMWTTGGRGGTVYEVTNLNDSGPGSLRDGLAIRDAGPRTVVFRVGGTIQLKSNLKIRSGNVTVAGQTAPGDGVCLSDYSLGVSADNVIIRHLRVRPGDRSGIELDSIGGRYHKFIVLDHCSASWSIDEAVSFYDNENLTVQWCLIAESLRTSKHSKGPHGYGGIWGGYSASYHHNLLASHSSRNPRFGNDRIDFRNNVIFNWGYNSAYGGEEGLINIVANYYKFGPATRPNVRNRIYKADPQRGKGWLGRYYVADNYVWGFPDTTDDNWIGVHGNYPIETVRIAQPHEVAPVRTHTAQQAYEAVLAHSGATLPWRDSLDRRIVEEVVTGNPSCGRAKTGIIDSQADVGGWPTLNSGKPADDTDHDGMDDRFEEAHGFDPQSPTDGPQDMDGDGYTNLEEFLNGTDPSVFVDYTDLRNNCDPTMR